MAFTQLNLQTQQLLESTFISDMRIILNANTTLLKNTVQDTFNALEVDPVNKKIGVDNPLTSLYATAIRLGNELQFTDGTTPIGSLTKSAGKSVLEVDSILIKAGGSIALGGAASTLAATRLGVGFSNPTQVTVDGLTIAPSSGLYVQGLLQLSNSAAESSESVTSTLTAVSGNPSVYECDITLNATSKQNIELVLIYPITAAAASSLATPIIVVNVYTNATTPPLKGQSFTFMVKSVKGSDNLDVDSTWINSASIRVIGGHDATKNRVLLNQQQAAATSPVTVVGPHFVYTSPAANYAGSGTVTVIDTTVPMRLITTSLAGSVIVQQP